MPGRNSQTVITKKLEKHQEKANQPDEKQTQQQSIREEKLIFTKPTVYYEDESAYLLAEARERSDKLKQIESDSEQIREMFADLNTLTEEQAPLIQSMTDNVKTAKTNTEKGHEQLVEASRRRMFCCCPYL